MTSHPYSLRHRLCSLDCLWMRVRHFSCQTCQIDSFRQTLGNHSHRANPHGSSVSVAVVRSRVVTEDPMLEHRGKAAVDIFPSHGLHCPYEIRCLPIRVIHQPPCYCQGHHCIISELRMKRDLSASKPSSGSSAKFKIPVLSVVPLVW